MAPAVLTVLPHNLTDGGVVPAATIMDCVPMANVMPFGLCKAKANPQVAAATSAAGGTLTPMPCVPVPQGPWSPGSTGVTIAGQRALTVGSTCSCAWTGVIEITDPASDIDVE
jgi:hypothetical protein